MTAPTSFGLARLAPALPAFLSAHPEVKVELALTDRFVDVVEEGVDVAIRGAPRAPSDIATHACLRHTRLHDAAAWTFYGPDGAQETVRVDGPLDVDNSLALRGALLAGWA